MPTSEASKNMLQLVPLKYMMSTSAAATPPTVPPLLSERYSG